MIPPALCSPDGVSLTSGYGEPFALQRVNSLRGGDLPGGDVIFLHQMGDGKPTAVYVTAGSFEVDNWIHESPNRKRLDISFSRVHRGRPRLAVCTVRLG